MAALYRADDFPNEGELIQVWVSPGYRGGKLAPDLMNAVFDWAASNSFGAIRAEVTFNNMQALRFYESYGFVRTAPNNSSAMQTHLLMKKVQQVSNLSEIATILNCTIPPTVNHLLK